MSGKKRFPPRFPRFAAGIRAQGRSDGKSARSWWWRKWMAKLEGMGMGSRLGKARNYALSGQVMRIKIEGPHVEADVVGTRPQPYRVVLDFRTPTGVARDRILAGIRKEPVTSARLLAGDLPMEVEELFAREGMELFPGGKLAPGLYDMTCACNCPDWANPCKHTGAVMYILGEEIARRPLTLLELRGFAEEELYED